MFDVTRLLTDVFDPQPGEIAAVVVDVPHEGIPESECFTIQPQDLQFFEGNGNNLANHSAKPMDTPLVP